MQSPAQNEYAQSLSLEMEQHSYSKVFSQIKWLYNKNMVAYAHTIVPDMCDRDWKITNQFKASLGFLVRPYFKKKNKQKE